jgi:hypothetical protein
MLIEVLVLVLAILLVIVMGLALTVLLLAWLQPRPPWPKGGWSDHGIDIIDPTPPRGAEWRKHLDDPVP